MPRPIAEMTNPGGIGAAISARLAKAGDARRILEAGTLDNGRAVTPNKAARLRLTIETCERELRELYARRDAVNSARDTAHGASLARASAADVEDWS